MLIVYDVISFMAFPLAAASLAALTKNFMARMFSKRPHNFYNLMLASERRGRESFFSSSHSSMSMSRAFSAANDTEASHPHAFAIQDEFYLISRVMRAFRGEEDDDDAPFRINKTEKLSSGNGSGVRGSGKEDEYAK
jgi:hypothetical protein